MKVNIVCVGKIKEKFYTDAVNEYAKRLGRFCEFKVIEVDEAPFNKSIEDRCKIEGEELLSKAKGFLVILDGKGKELASAELASFIKDKCNEGNSEFSFLIGGSNGHSDEVRKKANLLLSFGKATYPHQLFRVMLSEQIYRAFTIINGTPYNK